MTDIVRVISESAIEHIRSKPEMYLPAGASSVGTKLVGLLLVDSLALGIHDVQIVRNKDWYAIAADSDWLRRGKYALNIVDLFDRLVPLPEAGINSIRHEVVVAAFACDVLTSVQDETVIVKSSDDKNALADGLALCNRLLPMRAVAFRCPL